MKIGISGSPCSGKTTLASMLYSEFLKQGVEGAYLIHEYAKIHLASGGKIRGFNDQRLVGYKQMSVEAKLMSTNFSPIICDSCVWMGKVYCEFANYYGEEGLPKYLQDIHDFKYDMNIFVPLPRTDGETSEFRIHNGTQSAKISYMMEQELRSRDNVVYAPVNFNEREEFVKQLVTKWKEEYANEN